MKRLISTKDTFFYKIILPVFFLICAAVLPAAIYFDDRNILAAVLPAEMASHYRNGHSVAAIFVLVFLLMSAALVFVMTKALKKLSLDGNVLYVSNYRREIAVPLSNIDKILWFGDMRPTLIYLKTPAEFGKKINFYPNIKAANWESNPVVEELKELANLKK